MKTLIATNFDIHELQFINYQRPLLYIDQKVLLDLDEDDLLIQFRDKQYKLVIQDDRILLKLYDNELQVEKLHLQDLKPLPNNFYLIYIISDNNEFKIEYCIQKYQVYLPIMKRYYTRCYITQDVVSLIKGDVQYTVAYNKDKPAIIFENNSIKTEIIGDHEDYYNKMVMKNTVNYIVPLQRRFLVAKIISDKILPDIVVDKEHKLVKMDDYNFYLIVVTTQPVTISINKIQTNLVEIQTLIEFKNNEIYSKKYQFDEFGDNYVNELNQIIQKDLVYYNDLCFQLPYITVNIINFIKFLYNESYHGFYYVNQEQDYKTKILLNTQFEIAPQVIDNTKLLNIILLKNVINSLIDYANNYSTQITTTQSNINKLQEFKKDTTIKPMLINVRVYDDNGKELQLRFKEKDGKGYYKVDF